MQETSGHATRESFLQAKERRFILTDELPLFGVVRLQSITQEDKEWIDEAKQYITDDEGKLETVRVRGVFARSAIKMVVNDKGGTLFGPADEQWLSEVDYAASMKLQQWMNYHAEMGSSAPSNDELKKTSSDLKNGSSTNSQKSLENIG